MPGSLGGTDTEFRKHLLPYGGGRRHRARTQNKRSRETGGTVWKQLKSYPSLNFTNPITCRSPSALIIPRNHAFEDYYQEQGIVSAGEWDTFVEVLGKPLPAAFRINSSSLFSDEVRSNLENDFRKSLQAESVGFSEWEVLRPLPWYRDNLAWQSNFSRNQIRKSQALDRFHEFLKLENGLGNLTRQEAVSMVAPLFLDVCPDHFVLDVRAAPGSKTFQLLDLIHQSKKQGSRPKGMVVANDVNFKRCDLLIHRTKRICTANLIVTNHLGQHFPHLHLDQTLSGKELSGSRIDELVFDRVLCDVPCSGDGTLRKYPSIWEKWRSGIATGLHNLQVRLAMRGLSMLKVGGRMVYSTCSMNPIENEAVICEILRRHGGSIELTDVSTELPELIRRPGLRKWKVFDNGVWLNTYNDVPVSRRGRILPSMFPFGKSNKDCSRKNGNQENGRYMTSINECGLTEHPLASEEVFHFPLERCMRIIPHDQNTGAFFIAVLPKFSPSPVQEDIDNWRRNLSITGREPSEKLENQVKTDNNMSKVDSEEDKTETLCSGAAPTEDLICNGTKRNRLASEENSRWKDFDPVVFLKDESLIKSIRAFYGIDERFSLSGHLVIRNDNTSHPKRIYYISSAVKDVLKLNFTAGEQLKIPSVGLKMFQRQSLRRSGSMPCLYRVSSAGLPIVLPFITKQILYASLEDFKRLLRFKGVIFSDFADPSFSDKASNLMVGFCIVVLTEGKVNVSQHVPASESTIAINCWKGKIGLEVMFSEIHCHELLARLSRRTEGVGI